MTEEEKDLLLSLMLKADEEGLLNIYDGEENYYETKWIFLNAELCIIINKS